LIALGEPVKRKHCPRT